MSLTLGNFKNTNHDLLDSKKKIVVAYSGGLDSSVLLHLLANCYDHNRLLIWHVNHQLQNNAIEMEDFCRQQAETYQIQFRCTRLNLTHLKSNIESQARDARYRAFSNELLLSQDVLLTAHHADDQVETLLLNLCRGTGVLGLRGIASQLLINGMSCYRPLLSFTRDELVSYAEQHKISWIEDPSNAINDFDRNYVRHEITPLLKLRWPAVVQSFGKVSAYQKEAAECLEELALLDSEGCYVSNKFSNRQVLNAVTLKKLSLARQKNLIKFWLLGCSVVISSHQLNLLLKVLVSSDAEFKKIMFGSGFIALFQKQVFLVLKSDFVDTAKVNAWLKEHNGHYVCRLNRAIKNVSSHYLKRQFQALGIPPWLRDQTIFRLSDDSKRNVETIVL